MKIISYLRVSTSEQDLQSQKLAILEFAQKRVTLEELLIIGYLLKLCSI